MDTAKPLVYRHAHRGRQWLALAVLALSAAGLLALVVQFLVGGSGGPTPDIPTLGPFRWDRPADLGTA